MSQIFAILLLIVNRIFCPREPVVPEVVTEQLTEEDQDRDRDQDQDRDQEIV